jgi:hypothetical protein
VPRVTHPTTNFTAGEISPEALGRVDIAAYQNGAEVLENVFVTVRGGAKGRPGMRFSAAAKFSDKRARLIPFVFSRTDAYILEMGDLYMRFYKSTGRLGAPYEIVTPIDEDMLFETEFVQRSDTMFLTQEDMPPQRLRRFGDTSWQMDEQPLDPAPFAEIGHSFSATLTLSLATVGVGRTATASSGIWLQADVGREFYYLGGTAKITGYTSTTVVTVTITTPFASVNIPADVWTLAGSPQTTIVPSAKDPIGATITLDATAAALTTWRSADVGKFVRINGGLVEITAFTSNLIVDAKIIAALSATAGAPADAWTLEANVFSVGNGYPSACKIHQQRLVLGGSTAFPKTLWASEIGVYNGFTLGALDSDAFAYSMDDDQVSRIMHIASNKVLFALTDSTEFTVKGGVEKPITPTNVRVDPETAYGSHSVRPVRIGKDIIFVEADGKKVRSIGYDASEEDFDADDITVLSEHITGDGVVDMTYKQSPASLLMCAREDGQIAVCTIAKQQEVGAWTRWITDGVVESIATIPVPGGNQTWCLVRRTVNGATVRNVEVFDDDINLDCAISYSGAATATIPVPHLPNTLVHCIADGRYMGTFTVTAGNITLPRTTTEADIGLAYTNKVRLLTPEISTGEGSIQGNAMSTSAVVMSFLNTYNARVNGDLVPDFRNFGGGLLDQAPVAVTGFRRLTKLGWSNGTSVIEITNELPFPFHLRLVARILTANQ